MNSVTIWVVHGSPFWELGTMLIPRLHLVVYYTKGGVSEITGKQVERGYHISVRHDRICENGYRSQIIDGKGNPAVCVAASAKFAKPVLHRLAERVKAGDYDDLILDLYRQAVAMRPDYSWPSLLSEQDEAELHSAVSVIVNEGV